MLSPTSAHEPSIDVWVLNVEGLEVLVLELHHDILIGAVSDREVYREALLNYDLVAEADVGGEAHNNLRVSGDAAVIDEAN